MNKYKQRKSDFLTARSFFITGYGSAICIGGYNNQYNRSRTANEADMKAINNDWGIVGDNLKSAISKRVNKK